MSRNLATAKKQSVDNDMHMPTMLTVTELSEKTGISRFSIRRMVKENKVTYIKLGNKVLVNYDSLLKYLQTGENRG